MTIYLVWRRLDDDAVFRMKLVEVLHQDNDATDEKSDEVPHWTTVVVLPALSPHQYCFVDTIEILQRLNYEWLWTQLGLATRVRLST